MENEVEKKNEYFFRIIYYKSRKAFSDKNYYNW